MAFTEAATKKRAGVWVVRTMQEVDALDPGGIDVLTASLSDFTQALCRSNNALKRALADPKRFDGIGNAYGDEILHASRLSPLKRTRQLTDDEVIRLHQAAMQTLSIWIERLRAKLELRFLRKLPRFDPRCRCMENLVNPVQPVVRRCNEFDMPPTSATIVPVAKPTAGSCPTVRWLGC